jgi:predicted RecB family nuclease
MIQNTNQRLRGSFTEASKKQPASDLYPPTYTNGLKDIAQYIGFTWSDKSASGLQSVIWRRKRELTKDERFKDKLIEYNRNDREALLSVKKWIEF